MISLPFFSYGGTALHTNWCRLHRADREPYPTVDNLLELLRATTVHAVSHITGGGLANNLARVLPDGVRADIDRATWTPGPIFQLVQQVGQVSQADIEATLNQGVGMVAIPTGIISAGFVDQYSRIKRISEYGTEADIHFIRIHLTPPGPLGQCPAAGSGPAGGRHHRRRPAGTGHHCSPGRCGAPPR